MRGVAKAGKANLVKPLPTIKIGKGAAKSGPALGKLKQVVVDQHLHLPDMFEITFFDDPDDIDALADLKIGAEVTISGMAPGETKARDLVVGEVTAIEAVFAQFRHTVVRGYSADHRLHAVRRTRTFVNMKRSDIARKVAADAGLTIGEIAQTKTAHDHIGQVNETDWDFLTRQAQAVGFETGVVDGRFVFRRAADKAASGTQPELVFMKNLQSFRSRLTAGNIAKEAEVRVWDPLTAKVTSSKVPVKSDATKVNGHDPAAMPASFAGRKRAAAPPAKSGKGNFGPDPSDSAFVVSDWPLANGSAALSAANEAAASVGLHVGDTVAEAEGETTGSPDVRAGALVTISGVSKLFSGKWLITRAQHRFDNFGYHTEFEVSGRQTRSMLALASGGNAKRIAPRIEGVVCGVVTNNNDPEKKGRVKLTFPWLSSAYESDWAAVVQAGAGKASGAMFLPEVGDEVLAGFEFGDPQRAYVIGGLVNNASKYTKTLGGEPIKEKSKAGSVVWRGIVTPSGNRLAFHDEMPSGSGRPTASDLVLGTKDGRMSLVIDQAAGTVSLRCEPGKDSKKDEGTMKITCGKGGQITIDGGDALTLKADKSIKMVSGGSIEIKASKTGEVAVNGRMIKLNSK